MRFITSKYSLVFKLILLSLFLLLIYKQILSKSEVGDMYELYLLRLRDGNWIYLFLCILLMPLNWLIESKKWLTLLRESKPFTLKESFKAILSGLSVGIVTPQRIGEYAGRVLMLPNENRVEGVLATFLCSIAQNFINVMFGLLGIFFLNMHLRILEQYWFVLIFGAFFLAFVLLYFLYRNTHWIRNILERINLKERYKKWIYKLSYFKRVKAYTHIEVLFYSSIRYAVYACQYLLLLWFFGIDVGLFEGLSGISSIYLIQSGIPLPPILDIAARAEIAILIWSRFTENVLGILSATFLLWIINLIIPSLLGLFFVLKSNITNNS